MQNTILTKINFYLICLLPVLLISGPLLNNLNISLISIFFIIDLIIKKKIKILFDRNFFYLLIIYLYLILNSIFISENLNSIIKAFAFIRFILLAYALNFYFKQFQKKILRIWKIVFFIITFDIIFEYLLGYNIFGFSAGYPGRIASFTNDELIIGGFYFGFIMMILGFIRSESKKTFIICSIIFFIVAFLIGERSNFLKIFLMYLLFVIFFSNLPSILRVSFVLLMFISIFLAISNSKVFKGKYFQHIFLKKYSQKIFVPSNKIELIKHNTHFAHYYTAFLIFKENKLFGSGFRTFRYESFKEKYKIGNKHHLTKSPLLNHGNTHPHQFHFEILSNLGILGYLLIIFNFFIILLDKRKNDLNHLQLSSKLFLIASLIPILPSGSFFSTFNATIFWVNYAFLIYNKEHK
jgi:O-antigen ligase